MIRLLFVILFCVFIVSCSSLRKISFEPEKEIYHGKIKVITQHEYDAEKPVRNSKFTIQHSIIEFDAKGFKTNETRFDADTNLTAIWLFQYDKHHRLLDEKWLNADSSVAYHSIYIYNKKGNVVIEKNFGAKNIFKSMTTYNYSNWGLLQLKSVFNKDNKLLNQTTLKYFKTQIEEEVFNPDSSFISHVKYIFDKNKKPASIQEFDENGNSEDVSEYTYDHNKNITKFVHLITEDSTKEVYTYKYELDKKKNWTMKVEFKNDVPTKITLREYGYY